MHCCCCCAINTLLLLLLQDLSALPADIAAAVSELQQQQHELESEMQLRYLLPAAL